MQVSYVIAPSREVVPKGSSGHLSFAHAPIISGTVDGFLRPPTLSPNSPVPNPRWRRSCDRGGLRPAPGFEAGSPGSDGRAEPEAPPKPGYGLTRPV
ncbi:hypothetical protein NDU88_000450 [Pleurodeles waltl]|uniref:Uncharacterized protein n=1 Tax=Pleurodeles waltl TaxID=8319 RepID=A0AAV7Q1A0_PLEWA|nr:hypothetical protein NDU88_000450 [Pleurodeles waltl]